MGTSRVGDLASWSWEHKLSSAAVLALLLCCIVAVVLLTTGGSTQPSAKEEAQIRKQIDLWLSLNDYSWPGQLTAAEKLPQSYIDQAAAKEQSTLAAVGTDEFAAKESEDPRVSMLEAMRERGDIVYNGEHRILSFEYAGPSGANGQLYDVKVWSGESRGTWDSAQGKLEEIGKVDNVECCQYKMVPADGTWKIAKVRTLEFYEDDSQQYGPDTPHVRTL